MKGIEICKSPMEWVKKLKAKPMPTNELLTKYVLVLALIPAIATFIGGSIIGYSGGMMGVSWSYKVPIETGLISAVAYVIMTIIGVYVGGFVVNMLATNFKSKQNQERAMNLMALSATPALLAGILNIIPTLGALAMLAGLYGLYILYLGLPVMMETPKDQQMTYFIVALVVMVVVSAIIGTVVASLTMSASYGSMMGGTQVSYNMPSGMPSGMPSTYP